MKSFCVSMILISISTTGKSEQITAVQNNLAALSDMGSPRDTLWLPASPDKRYQNGWIWSKSGSWYYVGFISENIFPRRKVTYADAKDFCENTLKASLPVITTLDRDDKIWELSRITEIRNFWMSLRKTNETEFDWDVPYNVTDSDFTNWCTTNDRCTTFYRNASEVTEECVTYEATLIKLGKFKSGDEIHRFSGHWNPRDCNERSDVICQYIPHNDIQQPGSGSLIVPHDKYHNMLYYGGYWYTVLSDPHFRIPQRMTYALGINGCTQRHAELPYEDHDRHFPVVMTAKTFFERNVASSFYVKAGKIVNGEHRHNRLNRFSKHENFEQNVCILLNLTGENHKKEPTTQYEFTVCSQQHYIICERKHPEEIVEINVLPERGVGLISESPTLTPPLTTTLTPADPYQELREAGTPSVNANHSQSQQESVGPPGAADGPVAAAPGRQRA